MTTSTPQQAKTWNQLKQQVYHYLKKKKKKSQMLNSHCRSFWDRKEVEYSSHNLRLSSGYNVTTANTVTSSRCENLTESKSIRVQIKLCKANCTHLSLQ